MVKMLTLFGVEDLRELKYNDLKRELKAQKFVLLAIRTLLRIQSGKWGAVKTQTQEDKETITAIYVQHLEALIAEIENVMIHKEEPLSNHDSNHRRPKAQIRKENEERRREATRQRVEAHRINKSMMQDGLLVSWDKERFLLIAQDRGYQTEDAIVQDVSKELNIGLAKARILIDKGRFTWGQVLCLGALMQMTPKEFCDTFLAGYFTNQFGEYRASYSNISRTKLLKYSFRPTEASKPEVEEITLEQVMVGADGKPIDEEEWF